MKSSEQFIRSPSLDNILVKKRKSDAIDCTAFQSHKILKKDCVGQSSPGTKISNNVLLEESVTASEDTFQNSKQQEESVTASEDNDVTLKTDHALPILFKKYSVTDKPSLKACMSHHLFDAPVAQASHDLSETENLTFQNVEKQLPLKLDKEGSSKALKDVSVMNVGLKGQLDYGKNVFSSDMNAGISAITGDTKASSSEKDQLSWGTVTPQQVITGSAAELLAFKSAKLGEKSVRCTVAEGKDNSNEEDSAKKIIELIRKEEFGLNPDTSTKEDNTLKKQHARLGRALQCLSQELYSQDSHFLLELVQNADDNVYPRDVEPTLNFILQETGVVVLNNEQGFSAENIKALCDVGNSTKKEPSAGYIGKKGIGFKSVFRAVIHNKGFRECGTQRIAHILIHKITDAPEIHSNGFHIKFDVSDGQIGSVLPTNIPPCLIDSFSKLVSLDTDPMDKKHFNTCIILPFRS
ncbi:histidine kinase-, DNA gyrase B-, and HSP90-like ATPase family protein, partial [Tanacetum coccineum]